MVVGNSFQPCSSVEDETLHAVLLSNPSRLIAGCANAVRTIQRMSEQLTMVLSLTLTGFKHCR